MRSFMGKKGRDPRQGTCNRYQTQKFPRGRPTHYNILGRRACLREMLTRVMLVPRVYCHQGSLAGSKCQDLPHTLMKAQSCSVYNQTRAVGPEQCQTCANWASAPIWCGVVMPGAARAPWNDVLKHRLSLFQRTSLGNSKEDGSTNAKGERSDGNVSGRSHPSSTCRRYGQVIDPTNDQHATKSSSCQRTRPGGLGELSLAHVWPPQAA